MKPINLTAEQTLELLWQGGKLKFNGELYYQVGGSATVDRGVIHRLLFAKKVRWSGGFIRLTLSERPK